MGSHSIHTIKNIQFKLVNIILFEIAVYEFLRFKILKFCFENSIYDGVSKKLVVINENFEFVISKFMHEPPSTLNKYSVSSSCITDAAKGNPAFFIFHLYGKMVKW